MNDLQTLESLIKETAMIRSDNNIRSLFIGFKRNLANLITGNSRLDGVMHISSARKFPGAPLVMMEDTLNELEADAKELARPHAESAAISQCLRRLMADNQSD